MTRPHIIRADSIDLQDHDTPSAKDHKHPTVSIPGDNGQSLAPHQAETLREIAAETKEDRRISWANGDIGDISDLQQYADEVNGSTTTMQQQDALAIAQNGGVVASDASEVDTDGDGDMDDDDDDMMDKISSSPSIEDGVYIPELPPPWPARVDSLRAHCSISSCDSPSSQVSSDARSSSPYLQHPEYLPIPFQLPQLQSSKASAQASISHHHLTGEYTKPESDDSADDTTCDTVSHNGGASGGNERARRQQEITGSRLNDSNATDTGRGSIVGIRVKDFSVDRSPSTESINPDLDEPDDDTISPYDFLIPYDGSEDDDDDDAFSLTVDSRFVDSGWGGECLQDSEDIDFEFVYALHTFVATVEGQANATKGDTMVLLDDSNSYWWLVRVVKDSSIGYLPAEHIETPTERLARLNKHRNIDLSATMLGDTAEKTKNPIKTAIRRRKAKTVTFTAPTYVDYSEIEYSSDEEDPEAELYAQQQAAQQQTQQQQQTATQESAAEEAHDDETAKVEPLKPRSQQKQVKIEPIKPEEKKDEITAIADDDRGSDEILDNRAEPISRTTRNGTVRNTDSFFKDETVETKKITLTPNLLRDDNESRGSSDSKELRQRPSIDKLEKELVSDKSSKEKKKDKEKKEKDKKPSAIRSFFSRKDKKKSGDDDDESLGKRSLETAADVPEEETPAVDVESSPEKPSGPQRNPSKLQKQQPRAEPSPTRKPSNGKDTSPSIDLAQFPTADRKPSEASGANGASASLRMVESDALDSSDKLPPKEEKSKSGISKILHPTEGKPVKVSKAKSRVELDDFDSSDEAGVAPTSAPAPTRPAPTPDTSRQVSEEKQMRPTLPGSYPDSYLSTQTTSSQQTAMAANTPQPMDRLSESPVQVSPVTSNNPPALVGDTSSQEDRSSPISSPSPELVDVDGRGHHNQDSMTSTSATTTSTWNDASLRAFFDSSSDVRDMLVVVYDKTDVPPAGPDHPVTGSLFREQNAKLAEITTQLDNMLGDWLARKQRLRGTV